MAFREMEHNGGGIKTDNKILTTNSVGAIDLGVNISQRCVIGAYCTNVNSLRLVPFTISDGTNYIQCLDANWTKLGSGISIAVTYYYINNDSF